jgi:mannose-6-phosphate isomerase-like protein (cupin superfamily)
MKGIGGIQRMGKIVVRDSESMDPTIFKGRMSRRVISPERDNSTKISLHKVHRWAGISNPTQYEENDEILYILEGEGWIFEGDLKHHLKPGYSVLIPAKTTYQIFNPSDFVLLAILSPPRYRDEWGKREDLVKLESPLE